MCGISSTLETCHPEVTRFTANGVSVMDSSFWTFDFYRWKAVTYLRIPHAIVAHNAMCECLLRVNAHRSTRTCLANLRDYDFWL